MSNSNDMRNLMNVISEDGPLAPGAFTDPMNAMPEPTMDDPMDDIASSGPETKIEVTMKDGDEVEVEVYAKQGEELSRIMDLAGMLHKEKQTGALGAPDMGMEPDMAPDMAVAPDMAPDMGMEPDMAPDAAVAPDMAPDMSMEPEMSPTDDDFDINYGDGASNMDGVDDIGDISLGMDDSPEMDFDIADDVGPISDPNDDMYEDNVKKHDFGYPNPMQGQEEYELTAFNHAGGATKPVRIVPANSGDNALSDTPRKGLAEYINDVGSSKKKVLDETFNDDDVENTVAGLTSGVDVDDNTIDKLKKVAKDTQQGTSPDELSSEKEDDVLDAASAQGVQLNPNQKAKLQKNVQDQQKDDSISETNDDFKLSMVDEEELAERKRRYSFSHQDFGKGIVTTPDAKRKRSARRGLSIYKK